MTALLVKYRIQPDSVNRGQTEAYRPPSTREVIAWLTEHGATLVEALPDTPVQFIPGRYLVFRLDDE